MSGPEVIVVRTGTANTASVLAAFARLGAAARLSEDPRDVERAERIVLPGVGAFGAAMSSLTERGLVGPLRARLRDGARTLCVCLGLQLLFEESEESPGCAGLGVIAGRVERFPRSARVPQFGWNAVRAPDETGIVRSGQAYYANSFRAVAAPGWRAATTEYGGEFIGALEREGVAACQFHPELSGRWGLDLLARWLGTDRAGAPPDPGAAADGVAHAPPARIIPCLDVRDGRVVKGVRFANLRDAGDPAAQAARYDAEGADELVILDVSATTEGRAHQVETVRAVRRVLTVPLTVGGGVRTIDDAARLLDAGADKVAVNTAAVERPELIAEIASRLGSQCAVLALDAARTAAGSFEVVTHAGTRRTGIDAVAWAQRAASLGAGEILLTSYDRDGTGEGYDLALLGAVSGAVNVPVIASGGAADPSHMRDALGAGAAAILAATIFHEARWTVGEVKRALREAGVPVRLDRTREEVTP